MVVLANREVRKIVIVPPYSGVNGRVRKRHKASDSAQKICVCVPGLLALLYMSAKFGAIWTLRCAAQTSSKRPLDDFREVLKQVLDGPHPGKTGANA